MITDTQNRISLEDFQTAIANLLKDTSYIQLNGIEQHQEFISIIKEIDSSAIELRKNYSEQPWLFWSEGDSIPIQNMLIKMATKCYQNDNTIGIQVIDHLIDILPSQCSNQFNETSSKLLKTITNQPLKSNHTNHEIPINFIKAELGSSKASSIPEALSYISAKSRYSSNPILNQAEILTINDTIRELIANSRRIRPDSTTGINDLKSKYDKFIHLAKFIQHNSKVNPITLDDEMQPLINTLLNKVTSTECDTITELERSLDAIKLAILSNTTLTPDNKKDKIKFAETFCDIATREISSMSAKPNF